MWIKTEIICKDPPSMSLRICLAVSFAPTAGHRVGELFRQRGMTAIANDTVVDIGLTMLAIATSVVYMATAIAANMAVMLAYSALPELAEGGGAYSQFFLTFLASVLYGFVACVIIISTMLEVVRSGFKAVFVCFVQVTPPFHKIVENADKYYASVFRKFPGKINVSTIFEVWIRATSSWRMAYDIYGNVVVLSFLSHLRSFVIRTLWYKSGERPFPM